MADIGESKINFTFTVNEVNAILNVLGQAPFVQSAALINNIQAQGGPQVEALQAAQPAEEPEAAQPAEEPEAAQPAEEEANTNETPEA